MLSGDDLTDELDALSLAHTCLFPRDKNAPKEPPGFSSFRKRKYYSSNTKVEIISRHPKYWWLGPNQSDDKVHFSRNF